MSRLAPPLSALLLSFIVTSPLQLSASVPTDARHSQPQQSYACSAQSQIPAEECQALVDLYNATDGPNWTTDSGWLRSTRQPCDWYGVTCSSGHVTRLELPGNQLRRELPPTWSLPFLRTLDLENNALRGPFPEAMREFLQLEVVSLGNNNFQGGIPDWLGSLTQLITVDLRGNSFTGPVPIGVGQLSRLRSLNLRHNQLSGDVPLAVARFGSQGVECNLSDNADLQVPADPTFWNHAGEEGICRLPLSTGYDCTAQSEIPATECRALLAVFDETQGQGWTDNSGWLRSAPCDWLGVTCPNGHVTELRLVENGLSGSIPRQIGDFPELTRLQFQNNQLQGTLPAEIGALSKLQVLYLARNQLSGNLPPELGHLGELIGLYLGYNQFGGGLPAELANLTELNFLALNVNNLSGGVPDYLGQLPVLRTLNLRGNSFSGSVPASLGDAPRLERLLLHENSLSGSIPQELGASPALLQLTLYRNNLTGTIPETLGEVTTLQTLNLRQNNLTGQIPETFGQLTALTFLRLDENGLEGLVPLGVAQACANAETCNLANNPDLVVANTPDYLALATEGTLGGLAPQFSCLAQSDIPVVECRALEAVYYATGGPEWTVNTDWLQAPSPCNWHEVYCANGHVTQLLLVENQLSGSIPPEIGDLGELTNLRLHRNQLSGRIPPSIGNLSNLRGLYLGYNDLTGPLPSEMRNLREIRTLSINANSLSDSIPAFLGQFPYMSTLGLQANNFTGRIPPELADATALQRLNLHVNELTGPIPEGFGQLNALRILNLQDNHLTGPIPEDLGQATTLTQLALFGNELSGEVPAAIGQLTALTYLRLDGNQLEGTVPLSVAQVCVNAETCNLAENPDLVVPESAEYSALTTDGLIGGLALQPVETGPWVPASDDFQLEIAGIQMDQAAVRAVEIGDINVNLASTGTVLGNPTVAPTSARYGDLRITAEGDHLSDWLTRFQGGEDGPRSLQLTIVDPGSQPAFSFFFYDVVPEDILLDPQRPEVETLLATYGGLEWEGSDCGIVDGPVGWEISGVLPDGVPAVWGDWTAVVTADDLGRPAITPSSSEDGNLWMFSVEEQGVRSTFLRMLEELSNGVDPGFLSHTRIERNDAGAEVRRVNYFDAFISRYEFPRFDKDQVTPLSERVTFFSRRVEDGTAGTVLFDGQPNLLLDPILSNRFQLEIEGINLAQDQVQYVQIGDLEVDLLRAGLYGDRESLIPGRLRYGDVKIQTQGSTALSEWLGAPQQPRSLSVVAMGRDGVERFRYNLFEVTPVSMETSGGGVETLTANVSTVELSMTAGEAGTLPTTGLPSVWEWVGVKQLPSLLESQGGPVESIVDSEGAVRTTSSSAQDAELWEHSVRSLGVDRSVLEAVQLLDHGLDLRRSQSMIEFDGSGTETGRFNYFDSFVSRYGFPRFDKTLALPLSEQVTFLSRALEYATDGRMLFDGPPSMLTDPILTNQFQLEIEGINLPQDQIQYVSIGDITVDLEPGSPPAPGATHYGNVEIRSHGSALLSEWFDIPQPRAVSVIALGRDGTERFRYNLFEVTPVDVVTDADGSETLVATAWMIDLELSGNEAGAPEDAGLPAVWEWGGVGQFQTILHWQEEPVNLSGASFSSLSVRIPGANAAVWANLRRIQGGSDQLFSHSRIFRDASGTEVGRQDYFDTSLVRYSFPRWDKAGVGLVSHELTFLSPGN